MNKTRLIRSFTFVLFLFLTLCNFSCNGCGEFDLETCSREYNIDIPFSITPDTSVIQDVDSVSISMFLPNNSVDNITNDSLDLTNLAYNVHIGFFQLNPDNKEFQGLSIEEFAFDSDMTDGGVNRIGDTERTTGNLIFEDTNDGRLCLFKFVPKIKGLLGLKFKYSEELLDERDRKMPRLDFTETCCNEIAVINNTKIGGDRNNFHLIDNDTLSWQISGREFNLTDEDFLQAGIFLFQAE